MFQSQLKKPLSIMYRRYVYCYDNSFLVAFSYYALSVIVCDKNTNDSKIEMVIE